MRRRRECPQCGARFTTLEIRRPNPLWIRKRDGRRERFDRDKLAGGLARAAHKRPVSPEQIESVVGAIEAECEKRGGEIASERVGDLSLSALAALDRISYLQFAVVYRGFDDPSELMAELRLMGADPEPQIGGLDATGSVRSGEDGGRPTSKSGTER
ncbi:transcriptional regulator NrdR [soil metagenome]